MHLINSRLQHFGIPLSNTSIATLKWHKNLFLKFMAKKCHLLVVGEDYLDTCVQLARLLVIRNVGVEIDWMPQTSLDNFIDRKPVQFSFLVQLYVETHSHRLRNAGAFVNNAIKNGSNVVIGADSTEKLEDIFPYDIDFIESKFEFWRA